MEDIDLTLNQTIDDIKNKTSRDFNHAILKNGQMNNLNLLTLDLSFADLENADMGNTIFCQTEDNAVNINTGKTNSHTSQSVNTDVLSMIGSSSVSLTVGEDTLHLEDTEIYG